jgi:hypothetical protein
MDYASLLAKLTRYTYSFNNSRISDYVYADCFMGKYGWQLSSRRLYLSNPFSRLLGVLGERKKKLEDQYTKHSNDVLSVFRKWIRLFSIDFQDEILKQGDSIKTLPDLEMWEPFSWACEHLEDKYHATWEAWFGKEKGKEGYKALIAQCENQKDGIRKQIEDKIKDEIGVKYSYTFEDDKLNWLVTDIYDDIEHKVVTGNNLFRFEVERGGNVPPFIVSVRAGSISYHRLHYIDAGSDLEAMVDTLNSILNDAKLSEAMKSLELLKAERGKKLEQFITGIKSIIIAATYEFKGVEGKCRVCRDWKP